MIHFLFPQASISAYGDISINAYSLACKTTDSYSFNAICELKVESVNILKLCFRE